MRVILISMLFSFPMQCLANNYVFEAGHASLQEWLLPDEVPSPKSNPQTQQKIALGKQLFFDNRLSGNKGMSCASCHSPDKGWADNLPTAIGNKGKVLGRASPTIMNTGFNDIQMWDGRSPTLEDQALGPLESDVEMHTDMAELLLFLNNSAYTPIFNRVFPSKGVSKETMAQAIAAFERTLVSNNSPFDQWVKGDSGALTQNQINGFKLFVDSEKGNCAVCHSAPNFTDNGFHNLGLASFGQEKPDVGRYAKVPIKLMKGAFKTPTIRDITLSAPYFHDGSASTLDKVMVHYIKGGEVKTNLSPNLKVLSLTNKETSDIIAFMQSLTTPPEPFNLPVLPL